MVVVVVGRFHVKRVTNVKFHKDFDKKNIAALYAVSLAILYITFSYREPSISSLNQAKRNVERHYQLVGVSEEMDKLMQLVEFALPDYFAGSHKMYKRQSK